MFINRCAVCGDELFVLRCVLQTHVRLEQPIDQVTFLVLPADAREGSQEQTRGQNSSHIIEAAEATAPLSFVKEIVDLPRSSVVLVNCQLDGQADGMRYVHRIASPVVGLQPLTLVLSPLAKGRGEKGHTKCARHRFSFKERT